MIRSFSHKSIVLSTLFIVGFFAMLAAAPRVFAADYEIIPIITGGDVLDGLNVSLDSCHGSSNRYLYASDGNQVDFDVPDFVSNGYATGNGDCSEFQNGSFPLSLYNSMGGGQSDVARTYWLVSGSDRYYFIASYTSGHFAINGDFLFGAPDTSTRIISFTPEDSDVPIENPVIFSLHAYVSPDDVGDSFVIKIDYLNTNLNGIYVESERFLDSVVATTTGDFYFATTTSLADGNYLVEAGIKQSFLWGWIDNPLNFGLNDWQYHYFVVGNATVYGSLRTMTTDVINNLIGNGQTATTTASFTSTCVPFSGNPTTLFINSDFSLPACLAYLFIPSEAHMRGIFNGFKEKIATHFPFGYIYDALSVMTGTATSTIPVLSATLPTALGLGSGQHVSLDLNNVLDPILNATSSVFVSAEASSTASLYDITSHYWNIIVYIGLFLYILRRILGSAIVPGIGVSEVTRYNNYRKFKSSR